MAVRPLALPLYAGELFAFFAAAAAPSPLLVLFQGRWGFDAAMLTVVFAIYAVTLLLALLIAGAISDHVGRKPAIITALAAQAAAMMLFLVADGVASLLVARAVQGLATGIAAGALAAAILEAAPAGRRTGSLVNGFAPLAGLAAGGLASGWAIRELDNPEQVTFGGSAAFFVIAALLTTLLPETSARRPGAWKSLVPRVFVPAAARSTFVAAIPATFAVWALGGLYLSLVPPAMHEVFHIDSPMAGGVAIALLNGTGALAPLFLQRLSASVVTELGAASLSVGAALILSATAFASPALFFSGTFLAGAGFGSAFAGTLQQLGPLADPAQRAELFAAIYVVSYLAFSLPAVGAGIASRSLGLTASLEGYSALLVTAALLGVIATRTRRTAPIQVAG
ncbi:MFS transporter [Nocardioides sp.]|uniref:MFS transporter n=1 Tax=Nocardioides sp. TaxID=35761 RepID=UPI002C82AC67|nr:MFS transporter [Nocardioides sp.]HSX66849.1 MFS transporter [Nocardioides sp.]